MIYVGDILAFLLVLAGSYILTVCAVSMIRHREWAELLGIPIGVGLVFLGVYEMYLLRHDQVTYAKIICFHPGAFC